MIEKEEKTINQKPVAKEEDLTLEQMLRRGTLCHDYLEGIGLQYRGMTAWVERAADKEEVKTAIIKL